MATTFPITRGTNPEYDTRLGEYEVTYVDERKEVIKNLSKFCRDNDYSKSSVESLLNGSTKSHKNIAQIVRR